MNPLSARDVFLTVANHERHFPDRGRVFFILIECRLKGARDLGNAQPMRGLGHPQLDGETGHLPHDLRWNPKPCAISCQPNVSRRACLSVGKHDGFADHSDCAAPYSFKFLTPRRLTDAILVHVFGRAASCAVQSGSRRSLCPTLSLE